MNLKSFRRIVLLTEGESTPFLAKTAISMLRYRPKDVLAVLDRHEVGKTADQVFNVGGEIPFVDSLDRVEDADSLFIGIAPPGGKLPEAWRPMVVDAIRRGMAVVSGLHHFLTDDDEFVKLAQKSNAQLVDVRKNDEKETATGKGLNPGCFRIHTVGQDCSVGKMVTAIEVQKNLQDRGYDAGFAATGQTGMMIEGQGTPIDCVVSDFVNGSAERLVKSLDHHEFLVIEGQGCITHPAYSGVTLGLLHGCAPDAMVFCYEATRPHVKGFGEIPLQPIAKLVELYETVANTRHPSSVVGIAMNSRLLTDAQYREEKQRLESELGLPVVDVFRESADGLVGAILVRRDQVTENREGAIH